MKNLIRKIQIPLSILVGGFTAYWLIANPFETYTLPIIIIWLPDLIGWTAFFILLGVLAGLITLGICSSISEE
jgi:hypothetical protein